LTLSCVLREVFVTSPSRKLSRRKFIERLFVAVSPKTKNIFLQGIRNKSGERGRKLHAIFFLSRDPLISWNV
jgi:hypothetical protein